MAVYPTSKVISLSLLLPLCLSQTGLTVTLGQIQTFSEPTSDWIIGSGPGGGTPAQVPLEPTGGPAGAGDAFMRIVALGGIGPRSRLSAQNSDLWKGDYIAAGVNQIRMDVRNFDVTDLFLRLLFVEHGTSGPASAAFSSDAILVPGSGDWQTILFDVSPAALSAVTILPGTSPATTLSNVNELRIFHNPLPFFEPGMNPAVVAFLGVDNITAAVIPEPAAHTLLVIGLLLRPRSRRRLKR